MLAENSSPPLTSVPPRRRSAPPRPPPLPRPSLGSPSPTGPAASLPPPVLSTVKNGTPTPPPPPPPPPRPPPMALKTPLSSSPVKSVPPRRRSAPPRPPPLPRPSSGSPSPTGHAASPPPLVPSTVKNGTSPPRPPPMALKPPLYSPLEPNNPSTSTAAEGNHENVPKAKPKRFFTHADHSTVWPQIKSESFQFHKEMVETPFGRAPPDKNVNKPKESSSQEPSGQYIQAIDPNKSQNLAILIKAHNFTAEEVCDALQEGFEFPSEICRTLLTMAPTRDEEQKLRLFSGDLSRLGFVERFLKDLLDIPFAFKRLECLLFICTFEEEASMLKECFATLESACTELQKSRLFLNQLEAFLETGGHMNDGTFHGGDQQAFKLDTLLKLYDVKEKDGKTTLLHVAVQEIIRSEGIQAAHAAGASRSVSSINSDDLLNDSSPDTVEHYRSIGLQKVSGLVKELENVKRAAAIDTYILTGTFAKLVHGLSKARHFLNSEMKNVDEENGFYQMLKDFLQNAEVDVMWLLEEEKRIKALVKSAGDYFHGNSAENIGLRLFVIVRDFLIILDKVCKEVKMTPKNSK